MGRWWGRWVADLPGEAPADLPDWSVSVDVLQQQLVAAMFSGLLLLWIPKPRRL
ncbi:MAG: hypothetical protein M0Z54_11750 [Thermaerobacter sp.]|nr:hypothetical protein [Thermaerobacter sp.]